MRTSQKARVAATCLDYRLRRVRRPLLVSLSVTGRCNLRCPYCYISTYSREPTEMPLATLCRLIDDFYRLGTRIFMVQGGEPMIRKDIAQLVRYIKAKGCYCSMSSNGTVHKPIPELTGLDHLELSLDGPEEVNDQTRGQGTFAKVVEAARLAGAHGIPFHFHSVLSHHNTLEAHVRFVAELARSHDTYLTACFAQGSGYAGSQEFTAGISDEKIKEGYRMLIRLKREGLPIHNSHLALRHALHWPISHGQIGLPENLPPEYRERCLHGRLTAWLDHEGWLYPCTGTFGRPEYRENVYQDGVEGAWRRLSRLRCVDCGIASDLTYLFGLRLESLLKVGKY